MVARKTFVHHVISGLEILALVVVAFVMVTEAKAQSGNVYGGNQAQVYGSADEGLVLQVNIKTVEPTTANNVVGATVGGLLGGLVFGSNQNQDWNVRAASAVLGTTLGGVVGNKVANTVSTREAQELVIGIKNPQTGSINRVITVVQPEPYEALAPNDQVLVVNTGGAVRVIRRNYDSTLVQR